MPATFEPIATTTLGSSATNIEFTSIPNTYTDLRIRLVGTGSGDSTYVRFNGDTATNYSNTNLYGQGTVAASARDTSQAFINISDGSSTMFTTPCFFTLDIFSYAGSTNKTVLSTFSNDNNGSGEVNRAVGLWRSTSAITTVRLYMSGTGTFSTGTTATLFGIKAA